MLTGDLVRPRLHKRGDRLHITALKSRDAHHQQTAQALITLFQQHHKQPRHIWEQALEQFEGARTDYIVIRGLAKVLTDAAAFSPPTTLLAPAAVRQQAFLRGPVFDRPDLFRQQTREDVLTEIAAQLDLTPAAVEATLYADRQAAYIIADTGPDWTPETLIARYNLELARAALYWCDSMQVDIHDTYKEFWRYIKLFKLMFWASPIDSGYHVELDGPISPFVNATTRYGRQFAAFLPALFLCEQWQMRASIRWGRDKLVYELDNTAPLTTHFKRSGPFDSQLEADFAAEFQVKFGDERGQWQLTREDEVLLLGDTVMLPDFTVTHKQDHRRALIEIMGFWHPDYLRRKIEKVRAANRKDLILLVYEGVNLTPTALQKIPGEVLYFKNKPVLKEVMAAVERCAR